MSPGKAPSLGEPALSGLWDGQPCVPTVVSHSLLPEGPCPFPVALVFALHCVPGAAPQGCLVKFSTDFSFQLEPHPLREPVSA